MITIEHKKREKRQNRENRFSRFFTLTNICRIDATSKQQIVLWESFIYLKSIKVCEDVLLRIQWTLPNKVSEMFFFPKKFRISAFWHGDSVPNKWTIYICRSKKFNTMNPSNVLCKDSTFVSHLLPCWLPNAWHVAIFSTKRNLRLWTKWRMS